MRPQPGFIAALKAAIDAESDSDSDDELSGEPLGCEAEVAGSLKWTGTSVRSLGKGACRQLASIPETVMVC